MKTDANDILRAHGANGLRKAIDATPAESLLTTGAGSAGYGGGKESASDVAKQIAPAFSDEGLALRFADRHANDLQFVAAWGKWLSWTGTHWRFDDTLHAFDRARQIVREAAAACNKSKKIASAIASAKTVAAVERLSKSDRRLAATDDQWDENLDIINTPTKDTAR